MNISGVNNSIASVSRNRMSFRAASENVAPAPDNQSSNPQLKYSPAKLALVNGLTWGVLGFAFDKVCSKLFKYESKTKTSLALNGLIGLGMGIYTYFQAGKIAKSIDKAKQV